ncbi:hypothetical protein LXL04_015679 [Taraxacum kok-saghyz]
MRFPTKHLTDFVSDLNDTQKACLSSIGFGSVLKLKIGTFSKSLGFWVVDNYNPDTNSICFYNKTIKVTKERVNEIYGIPMGDEEMKINNEPVNILRPSIAYWTEKLLSERESKELEMGEYGNATVSTTDLLASSSRQAQDNDEADLEGNESEGGDVDEQARKLEDFLWEIEFNFKEIAKAKKNLKRLLESGIDFNFKDIAKAKKNLKKLLESGVKEYPESNELKERIGKHISEFGGDKRPEGDDESNEGDQTPIHDPSHTSVTTPGGQDSIPKENNVDKGKQIINEGCIEGAEEGDEEDSVPTMTQLLTPDDSDVNDDDIIDVMPLRYVPAAHPKRKIKPTTKAKSPYVKRVVDSCAQMEDIEMRVSGWVFSGMDSQCDVIYRNKFNDSVFKGVFESMISGSCVNATAIDIWVMQLSYTEQFRSRTSPVRLFMPSTILNNMVFD